LSIELILREPLGERGLAAGDFPLSIGGAGADVVVPAPSQGPLAWVGLQDGQLFLQPAHEAASVLHNGSHIAGSTWLRGGDVLDIGGGRLKLRVAEGRRLLEVVAGGADNATAPPVVEAASSVSGAGTPEDERIEAVAFRRQTAVPAAAHEGWPWRKFSVIAALVVLGAIAVLIFTSTPVQVEIDPTPERAAFEGGWPGLRLGSSHLLRPGRYTLVAELEGTKTCACRSRSAGAASGRINCALPGRLRIELPVPGAVRIDGQAAGKVPGDSSCRGARGAIDTERA
jgi:hypothetical protein